MTAVERYLDELAVTLHAAVLSDVLDAVGLRQQVMDSSLRPVAAGDRPLVGRAATMLAGDEATIPDHPYLTQIMATDALRPGDVVVASTQGASHAAFWGELFSTAACARGARGAVVDGLVRDVRAMRSMDFEVYAVGMRPVDSMGRLTVDRWNVSVRCGGVTVAPGDLVFAEIDGIVVVPRDVEEEVVARALEKVRRENGMRAALVEGAMLAEAWERHRVL